MELPLVPSTDLACYWTKNTAESPYSPIPLLESPCLAGKVLPPVKILSKAEESELVDLFASVLTASALGRHRIGRREVITAQLLNPEQSAHLTKVIDNCVISNLLDHLPSPPFQDNCCRELYLRLCNIDVTNIATVTMHNKTTWGLERQFRITGSRCYPIYTYSLNEWENKAFKYFWPKLFKSRYTDYGIAHESAARAAYIKSNGYTVAETGLVVNQKQPWLAYNPDGIVIKDGQPIKLLEIKCPYAGKDTLIL